jgi:hypothetical protein
VHASRAASRGGGAALSESITIGGHGALGGAGRAAMLEEKVAPPATLLTTSVKASHLGDAAPLVLKVEDAARRAVRDTHARTADFTLRLTIDRAGKLVKLEILGASDPRLEARLHALLDGLSSAVRASDADTGVLEVAIRAAR